MDTTKFVTRAFDKVVVLAENEDIPVAEFLCAMVIVSAHAVRDTLGERCLQSLLKHVEESFMNKQDNN